MVLIDTGLTGSKNKEILLSVLGQLSDGIWENSPSMEKYWQNIDIEEDDDGTLYLNYNIFELNIEEDRLKAWFAKKIKQIIKIEMEDNPGLGEWERTNKNISAYMGYNEEIAVADAYMAYETMLGRSTSGKYESVDKVEEIAKQDATWLCKYWPEDVEDKKQLSDKLRSLNLRKKPAGNKDVEIVGSRSNIEKFMLWLGINKGRFSEIKESKNLKENTGNFKVSSGGFPTYVSIYEEVDDDGEPLENPYYQEEFEEIQEAADYFSESELPAMIDEFIDALAEDESLIPEGEIDYLKIEFGGHIRLSVEPGYYSGYSLSIQEPYGIPTNRNVDEEVIKSIRNYMADQAVKKASNLAKEYGLKRASVSTRFSSGETIYDIKDLDESNMSSDFYGTAQGTEESDDMLFALQVFYGMPKAGYEEFRKMNISDDKVKEALAYVIKKGLNKSTFFDEYKRIFMEFFSWSEIDDYLDEIKAGATFENGKLAQYDSGYQVAWHRSKEVILDDLEAVKKYVDENKLKSFGIWFDNGKYILDTETMHVNDIETAIKIAKEANQKAIFDWENLESIYLDNIEDAMLQESSSFKSGDRYLGGLPEEPSDTEYGAAIERAKRREEDFLELTGFTKTRQGGLTIYRGVIDGEKVAISLIFIGTTYHVQSIMIGEKAVDKYKTKIGGSYPLYGGAKYFISIYDVLKNHKDSIVYRDSPTAYDLALENIEEANQKETVLATYSDEIMDALNSLGYECECYNDDCSAIIVFVDGGEAIIDLVDDDVYNPNTGDIIDDVESFISELKER